MGTYSQWLGASEVACEPAHSVGTSRLPPYSHVIHSMASGMMHSTKVRICDGSVKVNTSSLAGSGCSRSTVIGQAASVANSTVPGGSGVLVGWQVLLVW